MHRRPTLSRPRSGAFDVRGRPNPLLAKLERESEALRHERSSASICAARSESAVPQVESDEEVTVGASEAIEWDRNRAGEEGVRAKLRAVLGAVSSSMQRCSRPMRGAEMMRAPPPDPTPRPTPRRAHETTKHNKFGNKELAHNRPETAGVHVFLDYGRAAHITVSPHSTSRSVKEHTPPLVQNPPAGGHRISEQTVLIGTRTHTPPDSISSRHSGLTAKICVAAR